MTDSHHPTSLPCCGRRKVLHTLLASGALALANARQVVSAADNVRSIRDCIPLAVSAGQDGATAGNAEATQSEDEAAATRMAAILVEEKKTQSSFYVENVEFTRQLGRMANVLCEILGISLGHQPELALSDEAVWQMVPRDEKRGRTLDTVRLGKAHLRRVAADTATEHLLFSILAHEFSHVYQFVRAIDFKDPQFVFLRQGQITIEQLELHADFMAGYCLAHVQTLFGEQDKTFLRRFGDTFFRLGDYNFAGGDHHGTPAERFAATMAGYVETQGGKYSVHQIAEIGSVFVKRLKPDVPKAAV